MDQYSKNKSVYSQTTHYYYSKHLSLQKCLSTLNAVKLLFCCRATCFIVSVCQVVGVQDSRMGEEVCACIKLVDGEECTPEEIKAYCKGQVRRRDSTENWHFFHILPSYRTCFELFHLLLSDLSLQDSSLRTFCHQLPAHYYGKGKAAFSCRHGVVCEQACP